MPSPLASLIASVTDPAVAAAIAVGNDQYVTDYLNAPRASVQIPRGVVVTSALVAETTFAKLSALTPTQTAVFGVARDVGVTNFGDPAVVDVAVALGIPTTRAGSLAESSGLAGVTHADVAVALRGQPTITPMPLR